MKKIETPCIGVCSTGIGDEVCRGCKRYAREVIDWNAYSDDERGSILNRIDSLLDQIVLSRVTVIDEKKLDEFILRHDIRQGTSDGTGTKIFRILKAGGSQIMRPSSFGCALIHTDESLNKIELRFSDLCDEIDRDYYQLSVAHFERYFQHSQAGSNHRVVGNVGDK